MSRALPKIKAADVRRVTERLRVGQRPPVATAKVLILVVKLDYTRTPWPTRAAVAKHLGIAIPTVEAVLSKQTGLGRLQLRIETPMGNVKQRLGVVQHKYYLPSPELIAIVEGT